MKINSYRRIWGCLGIQGQVSHPLASVCVQHSGVRRETIVFVFVFVFLLYLYIHLCLHFYFQLYLYLSWSWSGLTVTIMSMFPTFQCQERNHCLCLWICIGIFHCICICIFPCLGQFSQPPSSACPQHSSVRRETTKMPVREKLGGMLVGDADKKVECRLKLKW